VGARRCVRTPLLRMVVISLPVASLALGIVIAAAVPTLRDTYHASNLQIGGIMALDALGIAIGTSLPARRVGYLGGLGALALGWGGFGIAPDLWLAGPLSVIGGIGNGIVIVRFRTMMQRETPPHERASSIGFAYAVTFSMIVVGQVAVVPLSDALGQRATFTLAGTVFALGGLFAALWWPRRVTAADRALREAADGSPVHAR
jgi:MFS family permease